MSTVLLACMVIALHDADTINVDCKPKRVKPLVVRVAEIDAPEFKAFTWGNQPGRTAARDEALRICPVGKPAQVRLTKYDTRTKRWIARVRCGGIDLSYDLAATGNAWPYLVDKGSTVPALAANAKAQGVNLWADPNAVAPSVWRKNGMHQPQGVNLP